MKIRKRDLFKAVRILVQQGDMHGKTILDLVARLEALTLRTEAYYDGAENRMDALFSQEAGTERRLDEHKTRMDVESRYTAGLCNRIDAIDGQVKNLNEQSVAQYASLVELNKRTDRPSGTPITVKVLSDRIDALEARFSPADPAAQAWTPPGPADHAARRRADETEAGWKARMRAEVAAEVAAEEAKRCHTCNGAGVVREYGPGRNIGTPVQCPTCTPVATESMIENPVPPEKPKCKTCGGTKTIQILYADGRREAATCGDCGEPKITLRGERV